MQASAGATLRAVADPADIFERLFAPLSQHGPGSDASTARALDAVPPLSPGARILDLGCGPGRQTRVLAQRGDVIALDLSREVLRRVTPGAEASGAERAQAARIDRVCGDMSALPFAAGSLDLIWSEGAIYNLGFAEGVRRLRPLLRPGGVLAVTDVAWLVDARPERLAAFWRRDYPGMGTRETHREAIAAAGYTLLREFVLPDSDWWDTYYRELQEQVDRLSREDLGAGRSVLDLIQEEIDVMREAGGVCAYVFYIMQNSR